MPPSVSTRSVIGVTVLLALGACNDKGREPVQEIGQRIIARAALAIYDSQLRVPTCYSGASNCDSDSLLNGRGVALGELHAPNNLKASCADGEQGTSADESVARIHLYKAADIPFQAGETVTLEVTVNVASPTQDRLDIFLADNASNPVWRGIARLTPSASGLNTLSLQLPLGSGAYQAVRAIMSRNVAGFPGACPNDGYADVDDLAFRVGQPDVYDASYRAPRCPTGVISCNSGNLLKGRGPLGPEPHASNTLNDSCADGTSGTYPQSASIETVTISSQNENEIQVGGAVSVDALVNVDSLDEIFEVYIMTDVGNSTWEKRLTIPFGQTGLQWTGTNIDLGNGATQAVRVHLGKVSGVCTGGAIDDYEDVILKPTRPFQVRDQYGRPLSYARSIKLVDWDGYLANPAIKLEVVPPPVPAGTTLSATVQGTGERLYFDLPSSVGASGPSKPLSFDSTAAQTVRMSIFPDRDGLSEHYRLIVSGGGSTTIIPIDVTDQDLPLPIKYPVIADFSQDLAGFFTDPKRRQVFQQAADDWAYFFDDMSLAAVPANDQLTWIWSPDVLVYQETQPDGTVVTKRGGWNGNLPAHNQPNISAYTGFLLYGAGVKGTGRSGGGASFGADAEHPKLQRTLSGTTLPLARSGGVSHEVSDVDGNPILWRVSTTDDDWWNFFYYCCNNPLDLYSLSVHEIGHAIVFSDPYPTLKTYLQKQQPGTSYLGWIDATAVVNYHGSGVVLDPGSGHLIHVDRSNPDSSKWTVVASEQDNASLMGSFGSGATTFDTRRWLITKLDILIAEAIGYKRRATSAFAPVIVASTTPRPGTVGRPYGYPLVVSGGVPGYNFTLVSGALPSGLTLDAYNGNIAGAPTARGSSTFTVKVEDGSFARASTTATRTIIIN